MFLRHAVKVVCNISKHDYQIRNASQLGFIGIGNMGARMVTNLLKNGEKVKVFDTLPENCKSVQGAQICTTPAEVLEGSSIVFTMLPNGDIVKDVLAGEAGLLKGAAKGALLVDCSTIQPQVAAELSTTCQRQGVDFLDAPVSGGVTGAQAGTLTFMVGGTTTALERVRPVLLKMGANVHHCGGPGAGQVAKLCNNLILAVTMIGTCEGMNLGIKLGLDPKVLTSIVNVSTGRSWSSETYNPVPGIVANVPPSNDYKGGFMVKLVAKDLGLAENVAVSCDAPVPLTAAAHQMYRTLMANGFGDKDFAYVYQFLKGKQ